MNCRSRGIPQSEQWKPCPWQFPNRVQLSGCRKCRRELDVRTGGRAGRGTRSGVLLLNRAYCRCVKPSCECSRVHGVVPYVMGSNMAIPNMFTWRMRTIRVLGPKLDQVVDAADPTYF